MANLEFADAFIRDSVKQPYLQEIAAELQHRFPTTTGLSVRSVRRYCNNNGICRSSRLTSSEVDDAVERAVCLVGPSYGRRTLTGLRFEGIIVGEQRVRYSMRRITPAYIERRRQHTYRQMNPMPYYAEYYGHKLHIDQNEKLVHFGVTHVAAYSGKLLGIISMPVKNPVLICDDLFRYVFKVDVLLITFCILGQSSQLLDFGTKFELIVDGSLHYCCLCNNCCQDIGQIQPGHHTCKQGQLRCVKFRTLVIFNPLFNGHLLDQSVIERCP